MIKGAVPQVLKAGGQEDKGDAAKMQYFVGSIALGDLVKSTLGPKGMDKILLSGPGEGSRADMSTVTNDGATILKSAWLDNPASRILVDVSKRQDSTCGDGTTGVVVLAAELLRNAEILVEKKIHPQVIIDGYRLALRAAISRLGELAIDNSEKKEEFENDLLKVARTTISSKLLTHEKEHFARLAVDAVLRLRGSANLDSIQIIKKPGGTMRDSYLDEGFILEKKIGAGQPKRVENCKVMVANTPMDTDKIKIYGAKVKVESYSEVQAVEEAEKHKMRTKVERIISHGCNVFINRQLIYNYPDQLFKEAGVVAIEHSDFEGMERLASVLGADIVSTFHTPEKNVLGTCALLEEIVIGEDRMLRFSGCAKNEACSIVLRGANKHILDEAERSLHDALAVLSQTVADSKVVWGGGAVEMAMAEAVDSAARVVEGKKSLAMESFAKALRQIPTIILDNGGFDSAEIVSQMKTAHSQNKPFIGIDIENGCPGDMSKVGILESRKSKLAQLCSAAEAAEMIIRVDEIIHCAPRQRQGM